MKFPLLPPALLALAFALTSPLLAQGPLTPPPGANSAIGPVNALNGSGQAQATMKTLHQVEPRTPLAPGSPGVTVRASGGFTITQPGSYYLTSNLTVDSDDGIVISSAGVTLDLSGFLLSGTGTGTNIAGVHITTPANAQGAITVRNGKIRGNGHYSTVTGAISGTSFAQGIKVDNTLHVIASHVDADSFQDTAFHLGATSRVENCSASYCKRGIFAEIVTHCHVSSAKTGIDVLRSATACSVSSGGPDVVGIMSTTNCTISACSVALAGKTGTNTCFSGGALVCHGCVAHLTVTSGDARCYASDKGVFTGCTAYVNNPATGASDLCLGFSNPNGLVKDCVAEALNPIARNTAIHARIAHSCVVVAGALNFSNKYDMP